MIRYFPLMILFAAAPALAVGTSHWIQSNEADFKKGTFHNVVATNLGDLKLSRAVKSLLEEDARVSSVYCLAEAPDGTVYAGTGPHGVLLALNGDKVTTLWTFEENSSISAVLIDPKGRLLIGTCGDKGHVYRLDPKAAKDKKIAPEEIFSATDVQYVWALAQTPDGLIYAATGPNGQLFEITPNGKNSVLLASDEFNLLSLLSDGKDLLYVGTDPSGLIYRINRKTKDVFVLYDAEAEVSCLALDAKGNLYAGTAAGSEKQGEAEEEAAKEKIGRPEGTGGVGLPAKPPENPKPGPIPEPNPGEPTPIPNKSPTRPNAARPSGAPVAFAIWTKGDATDTDGPATFPGPGGPGTPGGPGGPGVPGGAGPETGPTTGPAMPGQPEAPQEPRPEGNAIYRIDPDGFVTEIFRQPVLVYSIIEHEGTLLVGTGSDGLIYQVKPDAGETLILAKVEPKQVTSLLATRDGRVLLGLANVGGIESMSSGYANEGTYISPVLDATQISRFGKIHLDGSLPAGTELTVATRSGNVQDPAKMGWSKWSDEAPAAAYLPVTAPSARFLQYRLTLVSKQGKDAPVVDSVDVAYQMPNLAPVVKGVKVVAAGHGAGGGPEQGPADAGGPAASGTGVQTITWIAEDPNGDALQFSVYFRHGSRSPWILLKDKLTDTHFEWDTRTAADGRYEVKVVANDSAANPPGQGKTGSRVSDPFIVDNTPPVIGDIKWSVTGKNVKFDARIVDRTTTVASCEYSVDSTTDWQAVLPVDNIYDSPEAKVSLTIGPLAAGPHQITLRAADAKGNMAYETILVTVEKENP